MATLTNREPQAVDIPADQLEVYTQFGIAAEMAQVLETDASNVALAWLSIFVKTDEITPEQREWFRAISEDLDRKTFGQLLRSIKKLATYGEEMLGTVDTALAKRNYLMHRFFPFHNFALFSVEGRREMLAELDEMQKKLNAAHQILNGMSGSLIMLAATLDPGKPVSLDDERERLVARGRRVKF
jgi:hypothetical protein